VNDSMLVYQPAGADPTVAQMLDDLRDMVVTARDQGERPIGIVVTPHLYREVISAKAREIQRGAKVALFGIELVAPDV
jgi:hypothetical protein